MDGHGFKLISLLVIFGFVTLPAGAAASSGKSRYVRDAGNFAYDGHLGPQYWQGTCQNGLHQSPINIISEDAEYEVLPSVQVNDVYTRSEVFEAINTGYSLMGRLKDRDRKGTIVGGGLEDKFVFHQIHFHWESEHEFNGLRTPLEIHLVHYNSKYGALDPATEEKDGLAVLAAFCDEVNDKFSEVDNFIQKAILNGTLHGNSSLQYDGNGNPMKALMGKPKEMKTFFSHVLRTMLPNNLDRWYRYTGSLTTPPCDENVTWLVFVNRMTVHTETLKLLRSLPEAGGRFMRSNHRPTQPLNGRSVYYHVDESINTVDANGSHNLVPSSSLTLLLVAVLCVAFKV